MGLDEIKNLKVTIEIPEICATLEELGYDNEYIKTRFLCGDEDDIKEAIREDIIEYLCDFIEPIIIINGNISN